MSTRSNPGLAKAEIPWFDYKIWPSDTKTIIGSMLFAVCFAATMQIIERIETIIAGGILPVLGFIFQTEKKGLDTEKSLGLCCGK